MGILARIIRFLFWLLVLSWSISLLRRFFGWMLHDAGGTSPNQPMQDLPANKRLVRDPLCGMHVAEELAIPMRAGEEMIHFCSPECRDRYLSETQKLAANG
jgi:YHS domain-containing protein